MIGPRSLSTRNYCTKFSTSGTSGGSTSGTSGGSTNDTGGGGTSSTGGCFCLWSNWSERLILVDTGRSEGVCVLTEYRLNLVLGTGYNTGSFGDFITTATHYCLCLSNVAGLGSAYGYNKTRDSQPSVHIYSLNMAEDRCSTGHGSD